MSRKSIQKKIVRIKDKIFTNDQLTIMGNPIGSGFDTKVIIRARNTNYDGSQSIKVKTNKTVLMGRTKILEDNFGIRPDFTQHLFINDNVLGTTDPLTGNPLNPITSYNTPPEHLPRSNVDMFKKRSIGYWCAGDGAANKTIITSSHEPHQTDTKLFHMIPFRIIRVDESLPDSQRRLYKMEVVYPSSSPLVGYKGYYLKKIKYDTSKNGINMMVDGIEYLPKWGDTVPDLEAETIGIENTFKGYKVQQNYVDMEMDINSLEFKEWFMLTDGSLGNATVSEIGLIAGLDCVRNRGILEPMSSVNPEAPDYDIKAVYSEIYDAELFAHLTFDPYPVSRANALIDFQYRVLS